VATLDRFRGWIREKLNPAQATIQRDEGTNIGSESRLITYRNAFRNIDSVNRAVNMIVSASASLRLRRKRQSTRWCS